MSKRNRTNTRGKLVEPVVGSRKTSHLYWIALNNQESPIMSGRTP